MSQPLSFRWPEEFVARIDASRGSISRSRFVRDAVEGFIQDQAHQEALDRIAKSTREELGISRSKARMQVMQRGTRSLPSEPRSAVADVLTSRGSPSPSLARFANPETKR